MQVVSRELSFGNLYPGLAGRLLSEEPLGFDAGNSPPNFTDPTGLRQAGNPLASLPSVSRPFANLASLASTPSRSVSAPPTVPAAVPSSRYVSTPTLSHEQVAAQLSASNARINDIFVQNGLIAPRHVTKVTPVRIPGGGEEFRKVANSIADSYYSGVTGTNDILSPYFYTDAANQLAGGIVQGFGSVVGALGDTALPGYTNTLIEYSDNKNPRIIPGSPTSGELAGSALVFADPLFAGTSRPAGQLAFGAAERTGLSSSLPILNREFTPSGRTLVSATAQEQADRGAAGLLQSLSAQQRRAYNANPAAGSRFLGTAVHKQTDRALQSLYPERFTYNPSYGPDFLDATTGGYIELTTPGQVGRHAARGGLYNNVEYSTYVLPRTQP